MTREVLGVQKLRIYLLLSIMVIRKENTQWYHKNSHLEAKSL